MNKNIISNIVMKNIYKIGENIYITNDEEIKVGDWVIDDEQDVFQVLEINHTQGILRSDGFTYVIDICKKIILTTDQDLIKDGVQSIDDDFLEWFVKNPSCEEVEIGEGTRYEDEWIDNEDGGEIYQHQYCCYKIIIPKEEPKQDNNFFESLKKYFKITPHEEVMASWERSKQFDKVGPTVDGFLDNTNKQETLEEVKDLDFWKNNAEEDYLKVPLSVLRYISELERQQERMYSEEEMISFMQFIISQETLDNTSSVSKETAKYYLEQFKKK
jgi:hypothetical protein